MNKLLEMRSFVTVVDAGSFVGAAEALGLSKPAVSRHVAELEARLGVRLLHRTTRKLSLTAEGEIFDARCRELLAGVDEAEAEITARAGEAVGVLKINAPVTFGVRHLAPLWGGFIARHPRVSLDVSLSDRVVDLVEEGYDLAIRIASLPPSSLIGRQLARTRVILCASPAYLREAGTPVHPSELARHRVLAYSYWALGDEWRFDGPEGELRVHTRPCLRSNNGDTCLAGALAGQGLILQPSFLVHEALRDGSLVEVLPQYRAIELGIHALYPTRRFVAPKVRLMIDYLVEAFREPPWQE